MGEGIARSGRAEIHRSVDAGLRRSGGITATSEPTTVAPPVIDIADRLEKLASLMERGLPAPERFAQQKVKLLKR